MTSSEIRQSFLDFFKSKEHRIVQSASVIPHGDPTLLFTNAGMNQFKDVFLGTGKRDYMRAADTQKCIRVSGKHNDLEEVGFDTYHHTFFEMLGNWSFGDYYKSEAIECAWELLTHVWKLDKNRLYATVYRTDDEAFELWKRYLPESKILRFDEKDNFWEMGETGPCGPCSEIHYDRTPDLSGVKLVNAGTPDVIEIWNLVFIQYNRKQGGILENLTAKHVDTGMGFERICAVIQGKSSNYDTDVFMPLINEIEKLSGRKYSTELKNPDGVAMRVIADHIRTLSFAIADSALPSNEGRGYVLRRILRRASRFAKNIGFTEPVLFKLVPVLLNTMKDVFPELISNQNIIAKVIKGEEESFLQTLERGLEKFEDIKNKLQKENNKIISGDDAFQLYDTFGFPFDLTELLARENNFTVDKQGFEINMEQQRERSRNARKSVTQDVEIQDIKEKSVFTGYVELTTEAKVLFVKGNQIVLDRTPFYSESGGQISDTGTITLGGEKYRVNDVRKNGDAIIHFCDSDVESLIGEPALAEVDSDRRRNIMRNHSATHLLHEALRQILGEHVKQAGSLVAPDYLRFDFNHFEKVNNDDLKKIESIVNEKIFQNIEVKTDVLPIEEAKKNPRTKMFFGDKYGDIVRVVKMDENFSREFCGGTHVKNTSEIGFFKIVSESSIAAGVRRIEAITGKSLEEYINNTQEKLSGKQSEIELLHAQIKLLEREIAKNKIGDIRSQMQNWISNAKIINNIRIVSQQIETEDIEQLRQIGENLRDEFGSQGIGLLATIINEKVQLVCVVTDDIMKKYPSGKIVGEAAKQLGGGGGGKPHLATAGGKDISKLPDLLNNFHSLIEKMIS
ncbi:MAG: alanine--tRNA ligase [Ignavibacteriae bacterium]|nr:alanine--tRNA ligase [Ignavibacteriota bacterium]